MSFELKYENNGYHARFFGRISTKEIIECDKEIIGDRRFQKSSHIIADFSAVTSIHINNFDVKLIARMDGASEAWNREINLALVSEKLEHHVFFNEYINNAMKNKWEIRKFESLTEAKTYLAENAF